MAAGDGLAEFVTPYNTSQFEDLIRAITAHHNALAGQAQVVAVDLRRLLPMARNVGGNRGIAGIANIDLRLAARQVSRQFSQIAGAEYSIVAAAQKALSFYHGTFSAPTPGTGRAGVFDAGR
jgi:hypothetical protein